MKPASFVRLVLSVLTAACGTTIVAQQATPTSTSTPQQLPRFAPLEPDAALKSFRVLDGFRMDLLAAEPLVTDPVAAAYDEDGRLYVAEMNDYPYVDAAERPGRSPRTSPTRRSAASAC